MDKINPTVKRETLFIATGVLILSAVLQGVFLLLSYFRVLLWDGTYLLGNLLGVIAAVGNFFLMGLAVQKAVEKEEKQARATLQVSQTGRFILLFGVAMVGALVSVFNIWATLIPLLFPRIVIALRPVVDKKYAHTMAEERTAIGWDDDDEDDE